MKNVWLVLLAVAIWCPSVLNGATFVPGDIDERPGPKVYMLGNSHTDTVREELAGLAVAAGHEGFAYGTHTIPGAPLRWLRGHPRDSFEQLKSYSWDVVTLQSYNSTNEEEIQAAIAYAGAAREGNPDVRIIMYCIWPPGENWDNPGLGRREEWNEGVMARIREAHPGIDVHVAPTSLIIRRLGNMADAGLIPGLTSRRDLFADPGHMGPVGAYAIDLTFCAMIFNENPIGYPSAVLEARGGRAREEVAFDLGRDTARPIQRLVWDTLAEYEHDAVDTGMVINSGHLPPGVVGHTYDEPLPIVNAPAEPEWTIGEGELPAGLELTEGRITGTPMDTAEVNLGLKAEAEGQKSERAVKLLIEEDKPLAIPEPDLEMNVARNRYIYHTFKATGGVGRVRWSVAGGELPKGLMLVDGGLLMGTPGEKGSFPVTVEATDQHPAGPRTATRELTFEVGPAAGGVLRARRVTQEWTQDGRLDEPFWKLDNVLTDDRGNEVARFDAVWYEGPDDRRRVKTRDLLLAIKVTGESSDALPLESVHLYLDCRHNREIIYNEDDLHYVAFPGENREGERVVADEVVQGYKSGRHFDQAGAFSDDGTWLMEVEISRKVFAGHGVHTTFGPNVTYGFDLAVGSRDDPGKRAYLFGGPEADKDTSVFGSLVLEPAD